MTAMLNWYRAGSILRTHALPRRVPLPTLVLFGRRDLALQFGLVRESHARCDQGRLVGTEEASHWVQREAAVRVNTELCSFFKGDHVSDLI